ncbi:hypothetical protein CR513_40471, partial [Mucuna pruriens]
MDLDLVLEVEEPIPTLDNLQKTSKKPSIKHLHIWGCLAEERPYRPHERKLDSRKRNVRILKEVEPEKKETIRDIVFKEESLNDIENEDDIGLTEDDPINFCQAMQSYISKKWIDAMKDEMKSMQENDVWDLVELPEGDVKTAKTSHLDTSIYWLEELYLGSLLKHTFTTPSTIAAEFVLASRHPTMGYDCKTLSRVYRRPMALKVH